MCKICSSSLSLFSSKTMCQHSLGVSVCHHFSFLKWKTPTFISVIMWPNQPYLNPVNCKICVWVQTISEHNSWKLCSTCSSTQYTRRKFAIKSLSHYFLTTLLHMFIYNTLWHIKIKNSEILIYFVQYYHRTCNIHKYDTLKCKYACV